MGDAGKWEGGREMIMQTLHICLDIPRYILYIFTPGSAPIVGKPKLIAWGREEERGGGMGGGSAQPPPDLCIGKLAMSHFLNVFIPTYFVLFTPSPSIFDTGRLVSAY